MCGIVRNPTHRKNFAALIAQSGTPHIAEGIVELCEETHIPHKATELVLLLTESPLNGESAFSFPFAVYKEGKRFVSQLSMEYEEAVLHLAMAGSTLHYINEKLFSVGYQIVMGHCCEIRYHDTSQAEAAMRLAHDDNVYRADKLRMNPKTQTLGNVGFGKLLSPAQLALYTKLSQSEKCFVLS